MSQIMGESVLILSNDARDPDALRSILMSNGYVAYSVESLDGEAERALLETAASLALIHIDLRRDTLGQPAEVAPLGLLLRDSAYAERLETLIVTRTPAEVETTLGALLVRLGIPVLALPCSPDEAQAILALARERRRRRDALATAH
jgi:hypothetical protein